MFAMLGVVFEMSRGDTPQLWRRDLALMLDGLRATSRGSHVVNSLLVTILSTWLVAEAVRSGNIA
jgi:hypothetical protein